MKKAIKKLHEIVTELIKLVLEISTLIAVVKMVISELFK